MYVKKNLMLCLAVFALALPLLLTGTAVAKYQSDGAVADPTGGFIVPTDGVCVLSIDMSGNMVTDPTITSNKACQARLVDVTAVTSGDTLANVCGKTGSNTAAAKYAAPGGSTCVNIDGSGYITNSISMASLDRTAQICGTKGGQLANAIAATLSSGYVISTPTKTAANGTAAKCLAYGWQYRGQDAAGAPLAFGAKGTTAAANTGFCYTSIYTGITPSTSCPSIVGSTSGSATATSAAAFGYSISGSDCRYAYGVNGLITGALTKADGTTYAASTVQNLSAFTTLGDCLANGGSWANWIPMGTLSTIGSGTYAILNNAVTFDPATHSAVNADDGCLHCHSFNAQHNGPAERYKESYLKTGHKNMLRKVITGQLLTGPDGLAYTTDGTNTINMAAGTVNVGGTDRTLYYVYGDWMAALPTLVYANTGTTNGYTCGACHTTGYQDATNPGVQSIGTTGYTAAEPNASFPGINLGTANPKWDLEGITCGRCHNAAYPQVSQAQINASGFKTTAPVGQNGMGTLDGGVGRNNLCFGCHQSIAKNWPAQGGATSGTTQYNPTLIPTGISHGAASGRDFNGHVLGNSFLNSVHARYQGTNAGAGSITKNSLGKFDLTDPRPTSANTATEYKSDFKGYTCWQSTSSSSPGMTKADGSEISTKAECEALYGAGSWRMDTGSSSAGQAGYQGTCTTCHDVHNSLFVPAQAEKAMRKTCEKCHVENFTTGATDSRLTQIVTINHSQKPGTPFDLTKYESSCVVCHMALQAQENGDQNSMPVHVWRINTDAAYNTFPTADQFNGTNGASMDRNAQVAPERYTTLSGVTGTYNNAVWVDLDLACGQCHGGSLGTSKTHNVAPYFDKTYLSSTAKNMHSGARTADFRWETGKTGYTNYQVLFTATSPTTCSGGCTYSWAFGDGSTVSSASLTTMKTYATAATRTATLTVVEAGSTVGSSSKLVTPAYMGSVPVSLGTVTVTPGMTTTIAMNVTGGTPTYIVRVNWGDGVTTMNKNVASGVTTTTHTYVTARPYSVMVSATDSGVAGGNRQTKSQTISVLVSQSLGTVTGLVTMPSTSVIKDAMVTLKLGTVVKYLAYTKSDGRYTFTNVIPNTYDLTVSKGTTSTFVLLSYGVSAGTNTVSDIVLP
jgi:predicted CXXCH cytochrome family protein